jgi:hypothetical protein
VLGFDSPLRQEIFICLGPALESAHTLKVHKIENFFDSDFGICVISLLVMHK